MIQEKTLKVRGMSLVKIVSNNIYKKEFRKGTLFLQKHGCRFHIHYAYDKDIAIYDSTNTPHNITIPDVQDIDSIDYKRVSGDDVLVVSYKDGSEIEYDASDISEDERTEEQVEYPYEFKDEELENFLNERANDLIEIEQEEIIENEEQELPENTIEEIDNEEQELD